MPSKSVLRNFTKGGIYHIYNKGIEKRKIFIDEKDYQTFLYYLYIYLQPIKKVIEDYPRLPNRLRKKNVSAGVDILAYVLVPNHFHLILRQHEDEAISRLMKQVINAYTYYYNERHKHTGPVVEGRYKAATVDPENLVDFSRYVHLHPLTLKLVSHLEEYKWSSFLQFIGREEKTFCKKRTILSFFSSPSAYQAFVMKQEDYPKDVEKLKSIILEK